MIKRSKSEHIVVTELGSALKGGGSVLLRLELRLLLIRLNFHTYTFS